WTADSFTGAVADLRASIGERLGTRSGMALRPKTGGNRDFDYGAAAWLYAETLGQVDGVIAGKTHLFLDLRGALSALPPSLLLTAPPESADPQRAAWLIRQAALTVIPSLNSLRTAALAAARPPAPRQFLGLADPVYDAPAEVVVAAAEAGSLRGGLAP